VRPPDPARHLAWEVLRAVSARGAYANLLLPQLFRERRLDPRDRAFVTELAYGALRAEGTLDHVLAPASRRPLAEVDPGLLDVLRLGAYQLLRTRVPAHAAVAATVDLARAVAGEGPAKYANAVLRTTARRLAEAGDDVAARVGAPAYDEDPVGHLSLVHAHPRWIVAAFSDALGGDLVETAAALEADDARPVTHLVARRLDRDLLLAEALEAGLTDAEPGPWSPRAVRLAGGDPSRLAAVRDGRAAAQDEGSQLVALALADAAPGGGVTVDLCAGPGGKAALLASLLPDARTIAVELRPHRARLVAGALAADPRALTLVADGTAPPLLPGSADRVMVDAPCSGLGALRRRPEARWRRSPADVAGLAPLQRALLGAALDVVRPGGVVAYATCSPHLAETRDVAAAVLADRPDVVALDARRHLPAGMPGLGAGPAVQLWPHRHGTDAMHVALLRRGGDGRP